MQVLIHICQKKMLGLIFWQFSKSKRVTSENRQTVNQNKERPVHLSAKIIKFKNGYNFLTKSAEKSSFIIQIKGKSKPQNDRPASKKVIQRSCKWYF